MKKNDYNKNVRKCTKPVPKLISAGSKNTQNGIRQFLREKDSKKSKPASKSRLVPA